MDKADSDRGKIATLKLKRAIKFNGVEITEAIIEIDHINFGLNTKTKKLNTTKRSNFSINNIEKFIMLLDEEMLIPERYKNTISVFEIRIDCPVQGKFFQKEFVMIFQTDYKKQEQIHTVTLFPNW